MKNEGQDCRLKVVERLPSFTLHFHRMGLVLSKWAIPNKLCPPPIENVQRMSLENVNATYAKRLEFHLLFHKIFPEIQSEKTRNFGFWAHVWIISGNPC